MLVVGVCRTSLLRGDFLQSRVVFSKSAQNLAIRPSRKTAAPPSWF
jgi:hypothetical protein